MVAEQFYDLLQITVANVVYCIEAAVEGLTQDKELRYGEDCKEAAMLSAIAGVSRAKPVLISTVR